MIDTIALFIKGAILGGLLGFAGSAAYLTLVFGLPDFFELVAGGAGLGVILVSLISIPFSIVWRALFEGSLISAAWIGAIMGLAIALVVLVMRRVGADKRTAAWVCGSLALMAAVFFGLTQQTAITLSTGLTGVHIWILGGIYVGVAAWLGWKLREVSVA